MVKAICFSPEKIGPLRNAMNNKSPIKIKKFEYNDKFNNIVIKNNTAITPSADPLPFQRITSLETHMVTIDTLKKTSPQQLVNLKATVKSISGSKMVKVQSGSLNKSSATLVDPTGSITAVFWQEWADCVDIDKTYIFKNLRVKKNNFSGEVYANTAKEGFSFQETDAFTEPLAEAEPTVMEMTTKDATISIIGTKTVSCYYTCGACGKATEPTGKLLKCGSCKLKQRITPDSKHWFVKLFVKETTTNNKFYLSVFHQQLAKLLDACGKKVDAALTEDALTDILLEMNDLNITFNLADNKLLHIN